jgi:glycerophosphoryl diester phosphodiesterase
MSSRPVVVAHRGSSGYRPEHTRAAYELAIEQGADAIEPDLVASKDGVLVIRHDCELSATTDVASRHEFAYLKTTKTIAGHEFTGWFVEDLTWAELSTLRAKERLPQFRPGNAEFDGQQPILRFIDLLEIIELAPRPVSLVVELKHPTYFDSIGLPLDELVQRDLFIAGWNPQDERLIMESFEKGILVRLKEQGLGARHFYILEKGATSWEEIVWAQQQGVPSLSHDEELSDAGLEIFASKLDGLSLDARYLVDVETGDLAHGHALVAKIQDLGLQVYAWTLRPENRFLPAVLRKGDDLAAWGNWESAYQSVMALGVDGVFADHPDLAVRARP